MLHKKTWISLALALAMTAGLLAGCGTDDTAEEVVDPTPTPEATVETPDATPEEETTEPEDVQEEEPVIEQGDPITFGLLSGPTGMGGAKLWNDADAGETELTYDFFLASSPADEIVPRLINGELNVSALSTNLAATLYNATDGGIQLLALNTLGVLHILENGDTVNSIADLAGKTIYATGQGSNPEYVLNYLLETNGLTPGVDVTIEWLASDEVTALMVSGQIDLCMLPVPATTAVMVQNSDVRAAIDLNDTWEDAGLGGVLTMGCLVATTSWIEENPDLVDVLIEEYAASIQFALENSEEAATMMANYSITPSEAIALKAIPDANLVCLTGDDLYQIQDYYEVLFQADPTSIGGGIPDDAFYYVK